MRKALSILCLLLLLMACAVAAADRKYYSIGKLYDLIEEEYPNGWQESVETKWRTVEINTPVLVPDTDRMPILFLRLEENNEIDVSLLPGEGWKSDCGKRIFASRASEPSKPNFDKMKLESNHYYEPVDMEMRLADFDGKNAPGTGKGNDSCC